MKFNAIDQKEGVIKQVQPFVKYTFSRFRYDGGRLCAGLSAASGVEWQLVDGASEEHHTPAGAVQPFTWVVLRRPG